jgi:hypothetical protein
MGEQLKSHPQKRLVAPYEFSGWEVHTVGGIVLKIVADGVGLESDPREFSSVVDVPGGREEITLARMADAGIARLFTAEVMPYERPTSAANPRILSDPIPAWNVVLRDSVEFEVSADGFQPFEGWIEFFFRVQGEDCEWTEPVLFVQYADLQSTTLVSM